MQLGLHEDLLELRLRSDAPQVDMDAAAAPIVGVTSPISKQQVPFAPQDSVVGGIIHKRSSGVFGEKF